MAYLYDLSWIHSEENRHIIARDLNEASLCCSVNAFKAANILLGSVIEGALLYSIKQAHIKMPTFISLNQLLQLAQKNKLLNRSDVHFGHALRECRNLIHPGKCLAERYEINRKKTDLLFQICFQILKELQKNITLQV